MTTGTHRVSQAELARLLKVSRQAIGKQVARKVIEVGADGLIDVELARVAIASRVNPTAKTASAVAQSPAATIPDQAAPLQPPSGTLNAARTEREIAEAQLARLKVLEMTGKALDAAQVARETFEKARIARDAVMAVAPRIYQQLAAETDPMRVLAILRGALREVCREISAGELEPTRQ